MEAGSSNKWSVIRQKPISFFAILLLPLILTFLLYWAHNQSWLFTRIEIPFVLVGVIAPLTWISLFSLKRKVKVVTGITAGIVLIAVASSIATETARFHRIEKVSKEFVVPAGWNENFTYRGEERAPFAFTMEKQWSKSAGKAVTVEDFKKIAADNNMEIEKIIQPGCEIEHCFYSGEIDGVKVHLGYSEYHKFKTNRPWWNLQFDVEETLPKGFRLERERRCFDDPRSFGQSTCITHFK